MPKRENKVATILSGASLSDVIDLEGYSSLSIEIPSSWTAANLTFQSCDSANGTFVNVKDASGSDLIVVASASTKIVGIAGLVAERFIKIRSGTPASPVNQAAERTLKIALSEDEGSLNPNTLKTKGDVLELTGLSAGSLNADLVASMDVSGYRAFALHVQGTFSGTLSFQGSNDGSDWRAIGAQASSNPGNALGSSATGQGLYIGALHGFKYLRVRMTAYTSGTATGILMLSTLPTIWAVSNVNATQQGTWTVQLAPATSGGVTPVHLVSAASTNATNAKSSAGQVYGWNFYNNTGADLFVKLHNQAVTPTAGANVFMTIPVPAGDIAFASFANGIAFGTGIGYTTVTGSADTDTVAVGAGDLVGDLFIK